MVIKNEILSHKKYANSRELHNTIEKNRDSKELIDLLIKKYEHTENVRDPHLHMPYVNKDLLFLLREVKRLVDVVLKPMEYKAPDYEEMEYPEIQRIAKEYGLNAVGSKGSVIKRITDHEKYSITRERSNGS